MRKKKIKDVRPEFIMPCILIIPPDVTTYLYKMGYKTQEDIISMVSNLVINGR